MRRRDHQARNIAAALICLSAAACSSQPSAPALDTAGSPPAATMPATGGAATASSQSAGTSAPPGVRTAPVVPGRPGRVFIFAGLDDNCRPLPPPEITVAKPPAQGDISFRPGQATTIAASASGACKGVKATGTGVYYTARQGSAGSDSFTLVARMPTGETMTRNFAVRIAE